MSKIGTEYLAQTSDDMGMPELSKEAFEQMFGRDPIAELDNIMTEAGFVPKPPSAYELEKAHYDMWLWELHRYDDIHLIRELEERGYQIVRPS